MTTPGAHLTDMARRNVRPRTLRARRYVLSKVEREAGPLPTLTRADIEAWLDRYESPSTRGTYLGHLRSFYKWATDEGLMDHDPTARIKSPRVPRRLPRPLSEVELRMALAEAAPQVRAWIMCAAYAGLRACEIAPMRGEHVDRARRTIWIPQQKGGDPGVAPLAPLLAQELARWPSRGPLWSDHELSAGYVSNMVAAHFRDLGIVGGIHRCRHRFATRFLEVSGFDLRATQEAMRHRSPASTALYAEVTQDRLGIIVARIA